MVPLVCNRWLCRSDKQREHWQPFAVKENKSISEVSVREVQNAILDAKGYLLPYLDVELDHPMFKSLQRIGSTGILKGIGKSVDWSNQMWFRADTLLLANELKGLGDVYPLSISKLLKVIIPYQFRKLQR